MAKGKRDRRKKDKKHETQPAGDEASTSGAAQTSSNCGATAASSSSTSEPTPSTSAAATATASVVAIPSTSGVAATPGPAPSAQLQQLKIQPSTSEDKQKKEAEIADTFKKESAIKLPFAKRPDYGTLGRKVELIVNYYRLTVKKLRIYHYDVTVEKATSAKGDGDTSEKEPAKSRKISARTLNHMVVKQMCDTYSLPKQTFHGKFPVFDGQKNLYSAKELPLPEEGRFLVKLNEAGRDSEFFVTLQYARVIDYDPQRQRVAMDDITQVLEIMLTYGPRFAKQNPKLVIRSSLYDLNSQAVSLGENKSLRFGCYGNVKQTKEGLMFNLDRKAAVFHDGGMLISVMRNLGVELRPPYTLSKGDRNLIDGQLRQLKIAVIHMNYERKYTYLKLTEKSVSQIFFDNDGKKVSVKDYFEQTYKDSLRRLKISLNGNFPCVNVGKDKYLPLEVCKLVANQQYSGKLPEHLLSQMTRNASQMKPAERFRVINDYRNQVNADNRDYMSQIGVEMSDQMVHVTGRILPLPKLVNKDARSQQHRSFPPQAQGSWRMDATTHFFHTVQCTSWLVFSFAHPSVTRESVDMEQINEFVQNFRRVASRYGMQFSGLLEQPGFLNPGQFVSQIGERIFKKATTKYPNLQLMMFIIPSKIKGLYEEIKHAGDVVYGIPTQCVSSSHFTKQKRRGQLLPKLAFNDDYIGNLLQKVNSRLGGINVVLEPNSKPEYLKKSTMIVGIDASHPSPNDRVSRSVAACVASFDRNHSKFVTNVMVQDPFVKVRHENEDKEKLVEEIVKLDQMMVSLLKGYQEKNKKLPDNIMIFRDGVSDGQFKTVFEHEIQALKNSFSAFGHYNPNLTLIIVQKRHHTRFMPKESTSRSGNVMPGTCVDDTITSPIMWDYILCSHDGPLGTSRPARYAVLWDDYGFKSNELQLITYHCCYLYGRCLKSVSIPAPVYYAHLASKRARDHLKNFLDSDGQQSLVQMQTAVNTEKSINRNTTYFV